MNERIKEIAEQAGWMMGDEVKGFNIRLEKFAELIVRKCADLCYSTHDHKNILKHFGVEE